MLFDQAFSDSPDGWAFYNGELRHNSNNEGRKYGDAIKPGDVVAVILDTIEVSLTRSIRSRICPSLTTTFNKI